MSFLGDETPDVPVSCTQDTLTCRRASASVSWALWARRSPAARACRSVPQGFVVSGVAAGLALIVRPVAVIAGVIVTDFRTDVKRFPAVS